MDKLLLINRYQTDIELSLAKMVSVRATTLRHDRERMTPLRIPSGQSVDICKFLGMSKDEAKAVLQASPDYVRMHSRGKMVLLSDEEHAVHIETERPKIVPKAVQVETEVRDYSVVPGDTLDPPADAQPAQTDGLDPAVKQQFSDNLPSTRWDRERLAEYAKGKGIEVYDGMSKNAILRKIRGA